MSKKRRGKTLNMDAHATRIFLNVFEALEKDRIKKIIRKVRQKKRMKIPASIMKVLGGGKSCQKQTKK